MDKPDINIVIPVYNEEGNIKELYERLKKTLDSTSCIYEIIFIDDGSSDSSAQILEELNASDKRVRIIEFSRNFGHQIAITAGIDHSRGKATIIMDADLQDPPELIPQLIKKWHEGFNVVYAQRRIRKKENFFKKTSARFFYWLIRKISRTNIPANVGDFRLLDEKVVETLRQMKEYHRFIRGMIAWIGFRQTTVMFDRDPRFSGDTKYTVRKMLRFAVDGISSFSKTPLRIAIYIGFIVAILSFIAAVFTMIEKFIYKVTIQGWASLMTAILFLGGVQLICVGILGEYIGRIYEEGKKRPLYIIKNKNGSEDL